MEIYLKLIKRVAQPNEYGQSIMVETEKTVYAKAKSVSRSEFYQAGDRYTPEVVFEIRGYEYDGERQCEDEQGKRYDIIRTYKTDFENMEITCQLSNSDNT